MKVKDIMTRDVEVIHPNATIEDAASRMDQLDIGPLPVCDGYRLVGILTDRDITVRATSLGLDPKSTKVQDVMSTSLVYCLEEDDVREAARIMEEHKVRRLVVVNPEHRLVGIVSLGDLAVDARDENVSDEVLEGVSSPSKSGR